MDPNKKYLTQISSKDMKEISDAANIHNGNGIVITPTAKGLEVSIDTVVLEEWIKTVMNGGFIY